MPLRLLLLLLFLLATSNAVATEPGALRLRVWIRKKLDTEYPESK